MRNGELRWLMLERKEKDMALKGRAPNREELDHMGRVAEIGCIVCRNKGLYSPSEIHHTEGKTKEGAHLKVLPLCFEHHRMGSGKEPISRHPYKKRFEQAYGTEKELLKQVDDILGKRKDEFFDNMPF